MFHGSFGEECWQDIVTLQVAGVSGFTCCVLYWITLKSDFTYDAQNAIIDTVESVAAQLQH